MLLASRGDNDGKAVEARCYQGEEVGEGTGEPSVGQSVATVPEGLQGKWRGLDDSCLWKEQFDSCNTKCSVHN